MISHLEVRNPGGGIVAFERKIGGFVKGNRRLINSERRRLC